MMITAIVNFPLTPGMYPVVQRDWALHNLREK